ncbi:hypothetical protein COU97_01445 [Candidatus Shapirobacteria bacterium CG10_big_fil_rev_8_21_14_0_10_48_15]|uniref:Uncharacterized protein n=1 Tax=Candidatus Shapirobacteria bacterium CG10_big_fil_rev_8_21_14_0_10_48_15 TaxID=1974484 RepID=A0A2M8L795_9BACT|nr:MAG: hypothetical protein COU97_01445 [Candidatus Shapirobacteria bacterium CG10_big_fil_rev_8_21_14_0_10_48_15]
MVAPVSALFGLLIFSGAIKIFLRPSGLAGQILSLFCCLLLVSLLMILLYLGYWFGYYLQAKKRADYGKS